jgi:23S rRNA (guanosine2251-2'-O)-methyltransferase
VKEAFSGEQTRIHEVWIAEGKRSLRIKEIIRIAKSRNISVFFKAETELSGLLPGIAHQGVIALCAKSIYTNLNSIIRRA